MWFDNIDAMCEKAVGNFDVPSAVVAVGDGNGVYFKKAYGWLSDVPMCRREL